MAGMNAGARRGFSRHPAGGAFALAVQRIPHDEPCAMTSAGQPAAAVDGTQPASPLGDPLAVTERVIAERLSRILSWTGIAIALVAIPTVLLIAPEQWQRVAVSTSAGLIGVLGLWLLRCDRVRAASGIVMWGLWLTMAAGGVLNGGVQAPGLSASVVLAAFTALALGLRHGLLLCAATTLLCAALVAYERGGHAWPPAPPEFRAVLFTVLGVMTVLMLWSTAAMLRASALRAHAEAAQRAHAEARLQASQEELRVINAQLEARVAERTAQLAAANRELEAFSYSVAHDLRAPLRAIDGFSSGLEEDLGPRLDDATRHDVERIRSACRRMDEQIDGLLRLSRLTRAELRRRAVDLSALALGVGETLRQAHPARRVELAVAPGITVDADPGLLRVLLENLLGNAWKYSARVALARIEVGSAARAEGMALFVRDNGAGFDMAYADKLFSPFQRLHAAHEFEGTGIGLATVQRIVARHGGRVWAEAEPGKGATFWFTLPPAA
jgi:signal transduction histidine kinase